jgi:hypothetical protein
MIGEIEASVHEGREFLTRAQVMQSPHILNRVQTFANNLQQSYKDVQSVKEFVEEVNEVIPKIQDK